MSVVKCQTCGEYPLFQRELATHKCPPLWEILYDKTGADVRGTIHALLIEDAAAEYVRLHHVDFDYASEVDDIWVRKHGDAEPPVEFVVDVVPEPVCTAKRKKAS